MSDEDEIKYEDSETYLGPKEAWIFMILMRTKMYIK